MNANAAVTRKISFQTTEMEISLTEVEYEYLKFICEATLRDSDAVLREQIRAIQVPGLPAFDEWRQQRPTPVSVVQQTVSVAPVLAEVTAIASDTGATGEPIIVEPSATSMADPAAATIASRSRRSTTGKRSTARSHKATADTPTDETATLLAEIIEPTTENGTAAKSRSRRTPASPDTANRSKRAAKSTPVVESTPALPASDHNGATSPASKRKTSTRRKSEVDQTVTPTRSKRAAKTAPTNTATTTAAETNGATVNPEEPTTKPRRKSTATAKPTSRRSSKSASKDTTPPVEAPTAPPSTPMIDAPSASKSRRKSSTTPTKPSKRSNKRKAADAS